MSGSADLPTNFRFRIQWNGRYAAGFAEASPLPVDLKTPLQREQGAPPPAIGPEGQRTPFFINFERGVAFDLSFEQWISMVRCYGPATGKGSLLVEYKRPLTVEVLDEAQDVECVYHLSHCWVDEYKALSDADAGSTKIHIEHMRIGFDRWKRDPPGH